MQLRLRVRHILLTSLTLFILLITMSIASFAESINYVYDDLNRLVRVEFGDGTALTYSYDEVGNRTQKYIQLSSCTTPGLSSLSLNPGSVVGENTSQGTLLLNCPAPSEGAVVPLASSNTGVAEVPPTVIVPAGATSATFTVTHHPVPTIKSVTISANYNGIFKTATQTFIPKNWIDIAWTARNTITIANPGSTALSSYQVHVTLDSSFDFTKAKSDGSDLRITGEDGVTPLPFWVESWNPGAGSASLWVKVPSIPATGATLYLYYGNPAAGSISNGVATFEFFDDFNAGVGLTVDAGKWTATGGTWSVISDTQQDGSVGGVAKGTFGAARQALLSTYQGSDYIVEAYGKLLGGRVWGLGVRAADQNNLYVSNLYEDLDTTNNLYEYSRLNGSSTTLGSKAVGAIAVNTWYKLTVKVHANAIDLYKDNVLQLQTTSSQNAVGAAALYGEQNTIAEYNNVLVRKYTAIEPTVTLQSGLLPSVASVAVAPASVVGGSSSQGTVTLSGPAPSGGAVVSLASNNQTAAGVPATITVPVGSSSATFTVSANPVAVTTAAIISASYNGTSQMATLTITPPELSSLTLNPASVGGGSTSQGTVTLSGAAPSGGVVVSLLSDNTTAASVPSSVTVPSGSSSATFTVTANPVCTATSATISASYAGTTQTTTLTITNGFDPAAWTARNTITINNPGGTALSNYQAHVTLDSSFDFTNAKSDGSDLRFTGDDGVTPLPYWIESWDSVSKSASLWVKVPSIPVTGATLYLYYGNPAAGSISNGVATFEFFDDFNAGVGSTVDAGKWTATGGTWSVISDTQQDGSVGGVAKGTFGAARQALLSTYQSSDYIVEAYGKLLGGRVWGLGVRAADQNNLYVSNLYEDLDTTNNLYEYSRLNGSSTTLGSKAVGVIAANTWYKLTVKVHANAIDLYKDNVLMLQATSSQNALGAAALYGEQNTIAEYNNVLVRKYTAIEPTVTLQSGLLPSVVSVAVAPASVVGGSSSQGTVTLSAPAPSGGAVISLSSDNTAAVGVPATVTVSGGSSSATFTVSANPVAVTTAAIISASYAGATQTATLTVTTSSNNGFDPAAWTARNTTIISNPGGTALSNYQVHVTLDSSFDFTKAKSDGSDLRFTGDDGITPLPYWIESWDSVSKSASLWVKVPSIPATGATLYLYYGNSAAGSNANGVATFEFFDDFNAGVGSTVDAGKWTATGGTWLVVSDTQQDGSVGGVAKGTFGAARQALLSTYQGSDYIVEAYGKLLGGRVWGLGVRAADQNNLYVSNLYEDLDTTNNLYEYSRLNGSSTTLGSKAVGAIAANTWYKLTVKVHANAIDLYKDNVLQLQTTSSQNAVGAAALYGEQSTIAEYNNVLVRKYTAIEPTVTVQSGLLPSVASVAVAPASVVGGSSSQGTVVLSWSAPSEGAVVSLTSDNTAAAGVPATITVPGGSTSTTFTVSANPVAVTTAAIISASYGETSQTATLTITPPGLSSLTLNPSGIVGGSTSQGAVTLSGPAPNGGVIVSLLSSNPSVAGVPATVTVPNGSSSATFMVTASPVPATTSATISASYAGATQTATLTVTTSGISSLTLIPTSAVGGSTSQGTVVLSGPVPNEGAVVSLLSTKASVAGVPATVMVPSGNTSATFTVTANPVYTATPVTISASYGGTSQTATLTVTPPGVSSLTLNPTDVVGGNAAQGTVVLSGPAPSGGVVVSLASSDQSVAGVPASVVVPGGSTSAGFTVSASSISTAASVTISAAYAGSTRTAALAITPPNTNWLDQAWNTRTPITITNPGGSGLNSYQVHVTLDNSFDFTKVKSDGSDLRFTSNNGVTLLPFWIESWSPATGSASIWVKVPSLSAAGATIYLYYGNPPADSASSGTSTFEFFDDFDVSSAGNPSPGYFQLGPAQTIMVKDKPWENFAPHTLSVVEANSGGYTYWGYYALQDSCGGVGLAFSNDLSSWTKYTGNPLFLNGRWPSVLKVGDTFYMIYTKDYCHDSYLELATSSDGIRFTDVKRIVQPQSGKRNQNPDLYYNPNDGKYYIYWFAGNQPGDLIKSRSASTIEGLDDTGSETIVLQSNIEILAAPNMFYKDGTYFLSTESTDANGWNTKIYTSTSPTSGFALLPGNPVLADGSACFFQHQFGNYLHGYYCKQDQAGTWTLEHRSADLTAGRLSLTQQSTFDAGKWTATGGTWSVVSDTQPDGTVGGVAKVTLGGSRQALLSTYLGGDYILEAYGRLLGGRVWGLGVHAMDQNDLYSTNLYEDLDTADNLYEYSWLNGTSSTLGSTAVGRINTNTWYKLTVKAHSNSIDVYKDNVLMLQTSASQNAFGAAALYGEQNTIAEYNNVLVRKYAATEPAATIQPAELLPSVASVAVVPASVMSGEISQGTVVLSSPAPTGGVEVSLASSDQTAAGVPATVTVPAGSTSATFTITANPVSITTSVTISASYAGTNRTALLTITPSGMSSLSLTPTSAASGKIIQETAVLRGLAPGAGNVRYACIVTKNCLFSVGGESSG